MVHLNPGESMPTLTIRDCPPLLLARLRASAAAHRRSLNSEALVLLESALSPEPGTGDPEQLIAELRAFRASLPDLALSDDDLRAAIRAGRR